MFPISLGCHALPSAPTNCAVTTAVAETAERVEEAKPVIAVVSVRPHATHLARAKLVATMAVVEAAARAAINNNVKTVFALTHVSPNAQARVAAPMDVAVHAAPARRARIVRSVPV
jgi:hypothetical protein